MSKPLAFPALAQFVAATAGRNMTKAAYVAVATGVAMMLLLTVDPAYEAAHRWVDARAVGVPGLLCVRMGGPASPRLSAHRGWGYAAIRPRAGGCRRRGRGAARARAWRRSQNGMAAGRVLAAQGGPGDSGLAAVAPGAGAGIRAAVERAGDLPDGAVPGLGGGLFSGARRPAGRLRQRARGTMVGGRDPDHDGIWRRGADHAARPAGRGFCDDLRARRVRALDRHPRHRLCRGDPPRQFPARPGSR